MKARVIEQNGQVLILELLNKEKKVIKIACPCDLRNKEVLIVYEGGIFPTLQEVKR